MHGKHNHGPNSGSDALALSNNIAVDISFGTTRYPLVLSRAFKQVCREGGNEGGREGRREGGREGGIFNILMLNFR